MRLYVNARFLTQPFSGVQRYGMEISREIKKMQPDTVFLTPRNIRHPELAAVLGATVTGSFTGHLWEQWSLPACLKRAGNPPLLAPGNTAPVRYGNTFLTIHDLAFIHYPEWNSPAFAAWYGWLIPRVARKAKHVFTVSQTVQAEIARSFDLPKHRISVVGNGIAPGLMAAKRNLPKEKIILAVGQFSPRKNHRLLLDAFLSSSLKDTYRLCLIGDAGGTLKQAVVPAQYENAVHFFPGLSEEALADCYNRAEIVVSLSAYEGFGIPVLEGLYFGCKVLCSDIPVYRELYGDNVYFCDYHHVEAVSRSLEKIAEDGLLHAAVPLSEKYTYAATANTILKTVSEMSMHEAYH